MLRNKLRAYPVGSFMRCESLGRATIFALLVLLVPGSFATVPGEIVGPGVFPSIVSIDVRGLSVKFDETSTLEFMPGRILEAPCPTSHLVVVLRRTCVRIVLPCGQNADHQRNSGLFR